MAASGRDVGPTPAASAGLRRGRRPPSDDDVHVNLGQSRRPPVRAVDARPLAGRACDQSRRSRAGCSCVMWCHGRGDPNQSDLVCAGRSGPDGTICRLGSPTELCAQRRHQGRCGSRNGPSDTCAWMADVCPFSERRGHQRGHSVGNAEPRQHTSVRQLCLAVLPAATTLSNTL